MRDNPYRSPLAHDEPTPAYPSESCFWTIFLMGTSTFVVMLLLTTDLPAGANPQHSNPMWAAKQLLTSPLSLFHWGYRAPSTVSFLLGYLLHAAIWTCLVQGAPLLRSAFRSPAAWVSPLCVERGQRRPERQRRNRRLSPMAAWAGARSTRPRANRPWRPFRRRNRPPSAGQ